MCLIYAGNRNQSRFITLIKLTQKEACETSENQELRVTAPLLSNFKTWKLLLLDALKKINGGPFDFALFQGRTHRHILAFSFSWAGMIGATSTCRKLFQWDLLVFFGSHNKASSFGVARIERKIRNYSA